MVETGKRELLRALPSVDAALGAPDARTLVQRHGRVPVRAAVRDALQEMRRDILSGEDRGVSVESVLAEAALRLSARGLRRVVNATGVILHTNLGRSVLSERASEAAARAALAYSNLEYDLKAGGRGSRYDHSVPLLRELTGAGDALVVNNCAAATLLALSAVVDGAESEVIVSRGQLIEIGGGFRIPEVLALSGARLREVGTTNRTRLADYEQAIDGNTRAILWVHPSNFEISGFAESVALEELVSLGPPVIADVGSGAMVRVEDEPLARDALRAGAAVVTFSGDKLLGGPQAGICVGKAAPIQAMRSHPLARAVRADKLCIAALEATLDAYARGTASEELPTLRMLSEPTAEVERRARTLRQEILSCLPGLHTDVVPTVARSGGGTLPTYGIPSYAVRVSGVDAGALAARLRAASPAVVGRVKDGDLLLDARTLLEGDGEAVVDALEHALG